MKNKGITLISLIGYVIISMMVISVLIVVTTNFKNNFNEINTQTVHDVEFDKINLQISKEIKEGKKVDKENSNAIKLVFKEGNIYTFDSDEKAIYLNNNISVAENITNCKFEITDNNTLKVTVTINEVQRVMEYTLNKEYELN